MDVYKICPMAHAPRLYGECPSCRDWFVVRKDRRIMAHRDCDSYVMYDTGLCNLCGQYHKARAVSPFTEAPISLALMCVRCRHYGKPFINPIQLFSLTSAGFQAVAYNP